MKRIYKFFFDKVFKILISSSNETIFAKHFLFYSFIAILLIFYLFIFYADCLCSSLKLN